MNRNYIFTDINEALPYLLKDLGEADEVGSRVGRVKELTHVGITLDKPWQREILLPDRKVNITSQIAETMWVLAGRDDVEWLSHYLPRAKDYSDDGKIWRGAYGKRMRKWEGREQYQDGMQPIDQLAYVINELRANPLSRRAVISLWDPFIDNEPGVDIPCNNWLSFSSRLGKLDLHVAVRSNDAMWGWSGINAFEWSALQEIIAGLLGLEIGSLHFSTTSFHMYDRHWAKAKKIVDFHPGWLHTYDSSPRFDASEAAIGRNEGLVEDLDFWITEWFDIEKQIRVIGASSHAANLAIDDFPEPMLQSWLRVLQWWWSGDRVYLEALRGTRLEQATRVSVQPKSMMTRFIDKAVRDTRKRAPAEKALQHDLAAVLNYGGGPIDFPEEVKDEWLKANPRMGAPSPFLSYVTNLHNEKHAAYGNSWKKRGEMLGIMANIARKIDRLGGSDTKDETSADTAIDLFVYLAKYQVWLNENYPEPLNREEDKSDSTDAPNALMRNIEREAHGFYPILPQHVDLFEESLTDRFSTLEKIIKEDKDRVPTVYSMLKDAYRLARYRWEADQDEYRGADVD